MSLTWQILSVSVPKSTGPFEPTCPLGACIPRVELDDRIGAGRAAALLGELRGIAHIERRDRPAEHIVGAQPLLYGLLLDAAASGIERCGIERSIVFDGSAYDLLSCRIGPCQGSDGPDVPTEGSDIVCGACARPVLGEDKPGYGLRIFCAARACRRCSLLGSCRLGPTSRQEERSCCKACRAQKRSPADSCIPKLHCHVLFLSLSALPSDTKRARPDAQPRPCTCSAQDLSVGALKAIRP